MREKIVLMDGYSILNRTSHVNVGSLMLKYGGGGHKAVGTCQFSNENMDEMLPKMLEELVKDYLERNE